MSIPVWVLLAFAAWTLLTLAATHGTYRWWRIITRRSPPSEFGTYRVEGERGWYVRGMRAHANCVENLPVYGAIVVVLLATGVQGAWLDGLALVFLGARVPHTLVHVLFEQTDAVTLLRSALFHVQVLAMTAMIAVIVAAVS